MQAELTALVYPFDPLQSAHGRLLHPSVGTKGPEIMGPAEQSCRMFHCIFIQRFPDLIHISALKYIGQRAVPDSVNIGFPHGAEAAVETRSCLFYFQDRNILREILIYIT